jgi:peptide-methionine (R)-S-oxide reductase
MTRVFVPWTSGVCDPIKVPIGRGVAALAIVQVIGGNIAVSARNDDTAGQERVEKTNAEWRSELSPQQFHVCREKGTEPAFSGRYYATKEDGVYCCSCCRSELFDSGQKYDSGTGWPSFWQPALPNAVATEEDRSHGMVRTEVHCSHCGAHLGHVFPDGPRPTGTRYCINSVSLDFQSRQSLASDAHSGEAD